MPPPPRTVLFDADGVLQRSTIDWRTELGALAGPAGSPEDFVLEVLDAERPSLIGKGDFAEALAGVLTRWGSAALPDDVLALWTRFEADPAVVETISELRAAGIECHLATNQQAYRREYMRSRGYSDWFDREFYSCEMGVAKPDPAFFGAILDTLGVAAHHVLFIDDNPANVESAQGVGLRAEQYDLGAGTDALRDLLRAHGLPHLD